MSASVSLPDGTVSVHRAVFPFRNLPRSRETSLHFWYTPPTWSFPRAPLLQRVQFTPVTCSLRTGKPGTYSLHKSDSHSLETESWLRRRNQPSAGPLPESYSLLKIPPFPLDLATHPLCHPSRWDPWATSLSSFLSSSLSGT